MGKHHPWEHAAPTAPALVQHRLDLLRALFLQQSTRTLSLNRHVLRHELRCAHPRTQRAPHCLRLIVRPLKELGDGLG